MRKKYGVMDQAQNLKLSNPDSVIWQFCDLYLQNEVNNPYPAGLESHKVTRVNVAPSGTFLSGLFQLQGTEI